MYYIISVNEDGEVSVKEYTKLDLETELNKELADYGELELYREDVEEPDPMYWGKANNLIIKGEIVTPRSAKKVISYTID